MFSEFIVAIEKRSYGFEGEWEGMCGRVWGEERERRCYN